VNTLSLQYLGSTERHLGGWAVSFLIHGIAVGLSLALVTSLHLPPQSKVFKWDVAVVETPLPTPPNQAAPAEAKPAMVAPVPATPKPADSRPLEAKPVAQTVQAVQTIQPVQAVQQVARQEVRPVAPVVQERLQTTEQAPRQFAQVMSRPVQSLDTAPQTVSAPTEVVTAPDSRPVVREARQTAAAQIVASTPAVRQDAKAGNEVVARAIASVPIEKTAVKEVPIRSTPATRPDFGWLMEALWKSVEQRKGYPRQARIDRIEGKVTLRMVLKEDGRSADLVDLSIEESSGHVVLDRHALEVVRKAFPLELKHPLGQSQIVVDLPMTYRLDQTK
jgi:protein TonB